MISREVIEKIFDDDSEINPDWQGDNFVQGIQILSKYINPLKKDIVCGADHDVVYGPDIDDLIEKGLTVRDAEALQKLNWYIDEDLDSFCCFV